MQFTVPFELVYRYRSQVHTKHENLVSIKLKSEQKQGKK